MVVDDRRFPLVFVTCDREFTSASVDAFDSGFSRVLDRGTRFAVIADMRAVQQLPPRDVRRRLNAVLLRPDLRDRQAVLQVGSANLVDSVLIRAALGVVMWAWNPSWPVVTSATGEEAIAWSLARLRDAGVCVEALGDLVAMPTGA